MKVETRLIIDLGEIIIFTKSSKTYSSNYSITLQLSLLVTHSVLPCSFIYTHPLFINNTHIHPYTKLFSFFTHTPHNHKSFPLRLWQENIPKFGVEQIKGNGEFYLYLYYWAFNSRNFQTTCGPCSSMCTHVWTMNELKFN